MFFEVRYLIDSGVLGFLRYNFATGPGITGWVMWAALGIMVWFAREKSRRENFERSVQSLLHSSNVKLMYRFWYSHHVPIDPITVTKLI